MERDRNEVTCDRIAACGMPKRDNVQRPNVPNSGALRHVNLKKQLTTAGEPSSFTLN
jgi:hypothetical protein